MLKGQRSYPAVSLAATVRDLVTVPAIQALRSQVAAPSGGFDSFSRNRSALFCVMTTF